MPVEAMPTEPDLSPTEWMAVSVALRDAADCGCALPPEPGSLRDWADRIGRALVGRQPRTSLADPRLEALRRFMCETRIRRRPAEELAGALAEQGFSRAQISALAMLSA
jgi:hypothetical protein